MGTSSGARGAAESAAVHGGRKPRPGLPGGSAEAPDVRTASGRFIGSPAQASSPTCGAPGRTVQPRPREVAVKIAVLASIAHRVPPRSYGPWEQVASTLTEGLVARGHDVVLFATADSITTATLHAESPAGYEEDAVGRREGLRGAAHRRGLRARRRVRRDQQPVRLPAAGVQPAGGDPRGDDHPRLLLRADRPGLPRVRRRGALRRDQRRGPSPRPRPTRRRSTTGSRSSSSRRRRATAATCSSSAASTPTRARRTAIEVARRAGLPLVIAGVVHDEEYFRDRRRPARRRAGGHATWDRSGRTSGTRCSAGRSPCCTSSTSTSRSACPWPSRWWRARR